MESSTVIDGSGLGRNGSESCPVEPIDLIEGIRTNVLPLPDKYTIPTRMNVYAEQFVKRSVACTSIITI